MVKTGRANNVIRIPTSLQGNFFRVWMEFLTPICKLTNREKDVGAAFIKAKFELSKSVTDDALLDKIVMSDDIQNQIKAECNISDGFFHVILGKLKKAGLIVNGKLNPLFMPKRLKDGDSTFQLLLYFDLNAANNK